MGRGRAPWLRRHARGAQRRVEPADDFPAAPALADALATGIGVLDADVAARDIWAALPPTGDRSVLFFGEAIGAAGS